MEGSRAGARDDVARGGELSASMRARRPSSFGAVVVAWDGDDESPTFDRYLPPASERSGRASARVGGDAGDDERTSGCVGGAMLDVVAVDAPAMLADFGDYGEVRSLDEGSVARLRAADVVVLHHLNLLPSARGGGGRAPRRGRRRRGRASRRLGVSKVGTRG